MTKKKVKNETNDLTDCIMAWIKPKIEREQREQMKKEGIKDYELVKQ